MSASRVQRCRLSVCRTPRGTSFVAGVLIGLSVLVLLGSCDNLVIGSPFDSPHDGRIGTEDPGPEPSDLSDTKEITSFSFAKANNASLPFDIDGTIDGQTISVTVPSAAERGVLVATFATTGVTVTVGDVRQESGVTSNDFTSDITYTVAAEDGSTAEYLVSVEVGTVEISTPLLTPASGTEFYPEISVEISNRQDGVTYRYTSGDGSQAAPMSEGDGSDFDSAVTVSASATIKAVGFVTGYDPSAVGSAAYTGKVPAPTLTPSPGTYTSDETVSVASPLTGVAYHYTIGDGSQADPTTGDADLSAGALIDQNRTIKVIAFRTGYEPSDLVTGLYNRQIAQPLLTPGGGYSDADPYVVDVSNREGGATYRFTIAPAAPPAGPGDGSDFSAPITVELTQTINVVGFKPLLTDSDTTVAAYNVTSLWVNDGFAGDGSKSNPFGTVQEGIDLAINGYQVRVAAGTYNETITLKEAVHVAGGYSEDFSTRDDPAVDQGNGPNLTRIIDPTAAGGLVDAPRTAVFATGAGITSAAIIDGFWLQGSATAAYTSGVFCDAGATPLVRYNTINGGSGTVASYGVFAKNSDGRVENSFVSGGTGDTSEGVRLMSSDMTLVGNQINAGVAVGSNTRGIFATDSSLTMTECAVHGGVGGPSSFGVLLSGSGSSFVANTTIDGGNGTSTVYGVYVSSTDAVVVNSTVKAENGSDAPSVYGVHMSTPGISPVKIVNCIVDIAGSGTVTGIRVGTLPPELGYSCIFPNGGTDVDGALDPASSDNLIVGDLGTFNPALGGADGFELTAGTPPEVKTGAGSAWPGIAVPSSDKIAAVRTPPYSMGAYEYDL